jgi:flagellar protein FliO/FliZ
MASTAVITLAAVLALIVLAGQMIQRLGLVPGLRCRLGAASGARLAMVEALPLDARRRLLLVRCDGQELMLLVGGPQDLLIGPVKQDAAARSDA